MTEFVKLDCDLEESLESYHHRKMAIRIPLIKALHHGVKPKEITHVLNLYKKAYKLSKKESYEMFAKEFIMAYNISLDKPLDIKDLLTLDSFVDFINTLSEEDLGYIKGFLLI